MFKNVFNEVNGLSRSSKSLLVIGSSGVLLLTGFICSKLGQIKYMRYLEKYISEGFRNDLDNDPILQNCIDERINRLIENNIE